MPTPKNRTSEPENQPKIYEALPLLCLAVGFFYSFLLLFPITTIVHTYAVFLFSMITVTRSRIILKRLPSALNKLSIQETALMIGFIIFFINLSILTAARSFYWPKTKHPSMCTQVVNSPQNFPYTCAQYCKSMSPKRHRGLFLTDLDLTKGDYMLWHRKLAYYLYPTIDIRIDQKSPIDSIILFYKKDSQKVIPEGFQVIGALTSDCFFAVKKDIIPKP